MQCFSLDGADWDNAANMTEARAYSAIVDLDGQVFAGALSAVVG
jgi:hypothetical protein